MKYRRRRRTQYSATRLASITISLNVVAAAPGQEAVPLVPDAIGPSGTLQAALDAEWLTDDERSGLRVFHGVWAESDLRTPTARAMVALNAWRLDDPSLVDQSVSVELRAEAKLLAGELQEAIELLADADSIRAALLRARALETLGRDEEALEATYPVIALMQQEEIDDAAVLTDGVRAMAIAARIEGQPARDYQAMMALLAHASQQLDRLYWPARLAEAELLMEKHNQRDAVTALHETLGLNPGCAAAFHRLGEIALSRFDFDSALEAMMALRSMNPRHPLADLLYAESRLVQNDPEEALYVLRRLLDRQPMLRQAHALTAATYAMQYNAVAMQETLDRFDALSPGSAEAYFTVGRFLAMARQYDDAAAMLGEAIRRRPGWSAPQLELGLMEMQTGRDDRAREILQALVEFDPFDKRAGNSLLLLEEIADYAEIEAEHFVVRYKPGVDEVLAVLMPAQLDRIHETVAGRFDWTPPGKTILELMPDHKRFAVRIVGMPHVHTIAACTGPIIAMEAPREGKPSEHRGTFDWPRVIQHEYTHTVTLEQTANRIPHWLTEAAAVSMEPAPRDYGDCLMLARAWRDRTLFDLDEIKWAFVRPRLPGDRGKAYAQGFWMVQFMNERFGSEALIRLLKRYEQGEREEAAMPSALGVSRQRFFYEFLLWAGAQVESWGLCPVPSLVELTDELRTADPDLTLVMAASRQARLDAIVRSMVDRIGAPATPRDSPLTAGRWPELMRPPVEIDDAQLMAWRQAYPDQPDLLELEIRRRLEAMDEPGASLSPMLHRYAELRPVDPFPHKKLAQINLAGDDPTKATPHLEFLDAREQNTPVYAVPLAKLYRQVGDYESAHEKIMRAVNISPYDAPIRELAAAIAVQADRLDVARLHIKALTLLEPDRPQHLKRLERIDEMLRQQR